MPPDSTALPKSGVTGPSLLGLATNFEMAREPTALRFGVAMIIVLQ